MGRPIGHQDIDGSFARADLLRNTAHAHNVHAIRTVK
jgi:hypothetical protein